MNLDQDPRKSKEGILDLKKINKKIENKIIEILKIAGILIAIVGLLVSLISLAQYNYFKFQVILMDFNFLTGLFLIIFGIVVYALGVVITKLISIEKYTKR